MTAERAHTHIQKINNYNDDTRSGINSQIILHGNSHMIEL